MELHRNEKGQMLVMTAIELTLLIGFLALAADVGILFHTKRQMQIAADAAATAGALNEYNLNIGATTTTDTSAADAAAAANGFTNGSDGVVVTVNGGDTGNPVTTPYHNSSTTYVEAIISKPDPLYFFKFFTGNSTATVAARAVAGDPAYSTSCMWAKTQLYIKGSSCIAAPDGTGNCSSSSPKGCGIYIDSSASDAVYNQDQGTIINVGSLDTQGGGAKFQTSPTAVSPNSGPQVQPYTGIPTPDPVQSATNPDGPCKADGSNTYTHASYPDAAGDPLPTGVYSDYTDATGNTTSLQTVCFSQNVTIGNGGTSNPLMMGNGVYIFENGFTVNGIAQFGDVPVQNDPSYTIGALIYNYAGTVQYKSNSYLTAYDMTDGVYNGVALYQPASNSNPLNLQFGNSGATGYTNNCGDFGTTIDNTGLNGYIVAPSATVNLQDEGGTVAVTGIVANIIYNNSPLVSCNYNQTNAATTPLRNIALVE